MTFKPKTQSERILHRLKIAQGHLNKVINMTQEHAYCVDIIHQSQAVQKALADIDNLVLENHLRHCVADSIRKGKDKQAIDEIMAIVKKNK